MLPNIISAVIATASGLLVCFTNHTISKKVLAKSPNQYSFTILIHQILHIAFLAAVYLIASAIEAIDVAYPLVGAVLGMTVPMFFFTKKLLSLNDTIKTENAEKEDTADGREV